AYLLLNMVQRRVENYNCSNKDPVVNAAQNPTRGRSKLEATLGATTTTHPALRKNYLVQIDSFYAVILTNTSLQLALKVT
ncbi:46393_t:CDS:2, partial [Gigaspora margarita]